MGILNKQFVVVLHKHTFCWPFVAKDLYLLCYITDHATGETHVHEA